MIILDFHGANGGTGRCLREILHQLSRRGIPVDIAGLHRIIATYRQEWPQTRWHTLDRPRWRPAYWRIRRQRRKHGAESSFTDLLLELARRRARATKSLTFVNFPHVMPPSERERNFVPFVQDLNWRHFPENFHQPQRTDDWCRAWVARAPRVLVNSDFTRDELIRHYQCPPEKIISAPLAPFEDSTHDDAGATLSRRNLVSGRFYLFPAIWGVHKGHDILTAALERAATDPVVVTCCHPGQITAHFPPGIHRYAQSLPLRWDKLIAAKKLILAPRVSDAELQVFRNHCKAFVLPSRFEGFGLPLAEAIALHKPAIASDIPAFREILARYPRYPLAKVFPAGDAEALAARLNRDDLAPAPIPADWQKNLAADWSWQHTADRVLQALG